MRIGILEPDGFSEAALGQLRGLGEVVMAGEDNSSGFLADLDVLFIRLAFHIDRVFLARTPNLRVLVSPTTGHTHIDMNALKEKGVHLLSLKGETEFLENVRATPEHTIGLLLALLRNYKTAFLNPSNPVWDRDSYRGEEISGLKVGLIGYGRIGRRVAEYLRVFGAEVRWLDPNLENGTQDSGRADDLMELIAWSQAIILATSYEPGAQPVLGKAEIDALHGQYLVNTARGELIDEPTLLDAIEADRLAGVAVDVICNETGDNQLVRWLSLTEGRNVIVTPHIAGATWTSMRATEEFMAGKLAAVLDRGLLNEPGSIIQ